MSFKINLQTSKSNTTTIKNDQINKNLEVWQLKNLIRFEMKMKYNVKFDLIYNDIKMNDDNILNDYSITDSKNLIKMVIQVDKSTKLNRIKPINTPSDLIVVSPKQRELITKLGKCISKHESTLNFLDNFEQSFACFCVCICIYPLFVKQNIKNRRCVIR